MPAGKTLILCAGLQSSGTTLISYCFLQRSDTDGVLDAEYDLLPALDPRLARPYAWYKTTITCFRLSEMALHFSDAGWDVRTLFVMRDLRAVWASLRRKAYGRNGITAEDPPLRMRVRRFIDDWRNMKASGRATLRYEDFLTEPATTLKRACGQLGIPWDEAMLTWPKSVSHVADQSGGNDSFWKTRGRSAVETIARYPKTPSTPRLSAAELEWLETEFQDFNLANGYPLQLNCVTESPNSPIVSDSSEIDPPSFEVTRRYEWENKRKPLRWLLARLGHRNAKLIDQRSWKRAA
jgi:hypothetical protein